MENTLKTSGQVAMAAAPVKKEFGGGLTETDKITAKTIVPAPSPVPSSGAGANQLGASLAGTASPVMVEPAVLVKFAKVTKEELAKLNAVAKEFAKQQDLRTRHSPSLQIQRVRDAAKAYALDPNSRTLEVLRHEKSLEPHEHAQAQQIAVFKMRDLYRDQVAPLVGPIYRRFAAELDAAIESIQATHLATYAQFDCIAPPHPLAEQLKGIARAHRAIAERGSGTGSEMPELLSAILANAEK